MRFDTLPALLSANAREDRHLTLIEGEKEQRVLSFQRLRQRALGVLAALQRQGLRPGDTMILCLADNERFLEMFWACVLGGIVPVPLAPGSTDAHRQKLLRVFAQLGGARVYIDLPALERLEAYAAANGLDGTFAQLRAAAFAPGSLALGEAPGEPFASGADALAFIQFSSGSTGEPKGVLLTHRNLTANIASIAEAAAFTDRDVALSWMPLSHDMGLIGFHLTMLACGISHAIMRTELFARRPLLWLEKAGERRATVLCSPNFGYQHYLRQFALKQTGGIDLSAVRLVFNGAEPISADLCRRFVTALAPHGLKANALFPVYGLAEASLAVSFPAPGAPLATVWLSRASLQTGAPVRVAGPNAPDAVEFVQLGRALPGTEVRIVDATGTALPERHLGPIEIRGENVSAGYHRGADATAGPRQPAEWMDTGDLGLFFDGQLVVAGRAKDLIIVNGQNYYPSDIEQVAEQVEGLETNRVAAAGVRSGPDASEALAIFVVHRASLESLVPTALALRSAISQRTGLDVAHVVPVGSMPRTTSGKLQRHALVKAFEEGMFAAILAQLEALLQAATSAPEAGGQPSSIVDRLLAICRPLAPGQQIAPETNLLEINLNSLTLARMHEAIEREFPQRMEITDFFEHPTLEQLAVVLQQPRA
ncbi:non-ribosomal peptide synthetase [Ramlibacter alkalitolerans]|uniref:AMP-binding protein n=1 Tax=Ramlibacter alkalitolerans TaxID=2039631 RepID=A0ABS1JW40_9BURK|nr:non-ribosomal peptide synthetase [Ramlibacter alkalitolerans]MBL0428499.1 AMP-binding protein [Ramlibacter alkalitolerans]